MKNHNSQRLPAWLLPTLLAVFTANAPANEALARKNDCLGCHSKTKLLVGPAYQEVAAKYTGQPDARDTLVKSIRNGSVGKWGDVPMPPHPKLSETDAKRLATWILDGAK